MGPHGKKEYEMAIVNFCLQIVQNRGQSGVNFLFSTRVVKFNFSPPGGLRCHLKGILSFRGEAYSCLRHLEHPNLSIILDSIGRAEIVQQLWRNGKEQRSKMLLERLLMDF